MASNPFEFNEIIAHYTNGYTMQWQKGDPALEKGAGSVALYSLHDGANTVQALLRVDEKEHGLLTCLGPDDTRISREAAGCVIQFLREKKYHLHSKLGHTSFLYQDGEYYFEEDLPEGFHYPSSLSLEECFELRHLPNGLKVDGTLFLQDSVIEVLPDDLQVEHIKLDDSAVRVIGAGTRIGGKLSLVMSQVETLGDGLQVGGKLTIADCPLNHLPANLSVGGDFHLFGEQFTSLPAGLRIGGDVILQSTGITSVPSDAVIGGSVTFA